MTETDRSILLTKQIEVRWGDMDALGHVNNTLFLRYLEEIRVDWFNSFDGDWSTPDLGPLVARILINFRQAIVWPATVIIDLSARWNGGKSLILEHEIRDQDERAVLYADAEIVCVWFDYQAETTCSLPKTVIRALDVPCD